MTRRRTLTAVLAAAALIAPAGAQAGPPDMHASVAQALAAERAQSQPSHDLRSPDARDAAVRPQKAIAAPAPAPAPAPVATDGGGGGGSSLPIDPPAPAPAPAPALTTDGGGGS